MSWLRTLNETYINAVNTKEANDPVNQLLPISHTTQLAEIEVTVNHLGNYVRARVIEDKGDRQTLIPCTEDSASRAGPGARLRPHSLHDKLQYVAGDYSVFGGSKGRESYEIYIQQLEAWMESSYGDPNIEAILLYLKKGLLIKDLVNDGVLHTDSDNLLLNKWTGDTDKPAIFTAVAGIASDAFIRFNILQDDDLTLMNPWENTILQQAYSNYYESKQDERGLDYVTGEMLALTTLHPKKIRHTGDSAKLLSANDSAGFTFRGRFEAADETSQVAYSVSQQAHNALKWLIQKQGVRVGERIFLVWGTGGEMLPNPTDGSQEIIDVFAFVHEESSEPSVNDLPEIYSQETYLSEEALASEFKQALRGFQADLSTNSNVALIVLDAATTGRMAVTFYREYSSGERNQYFQSLESWHARLTWQNLGFSRRQEKAVRYMGAPSLKDIALAAFGVQRGNFLELDSKVMAQTVQRLFPCVIDEHLKIPGDVVRAAFTNALYPQKYSDYNWSKVRGTACSLIRADRNQRYSENWRLDVMTDVKNIAYNFGRWMAVLDEIETRALTLDGTKKARSTSVERYFSKLAERPCATTEIIMKQLVPYRARLAARGNRLYQMEQEIASAIDPDEFADARSLDGRFLLGYDSQKYAIYQGYTERREKREAEEAEQ